MLRLDYGRARLYTKLEYTNFSGSVKDRAAYNIIYQGILKGSINQDTVIVESSSGNFALALAHITRILGLKFIPVIDPNVNESYETQLKLMTDRVEKVTRQDETGGHLLTRLERVQQVCEEEPNSFWTNQYENPDNYLGYYHTLGNEICNDFDQLDYVFIGVSSGGTITGVSKRVKEKYPNVKIVAVDVEGSVIFGCKPRKRFVSGIGSSKVPGLLASALIDDVVHVSFDELVQGCHELLKEQMLFCGGSSGASYAAAKKYLKKHDVSPDARAVFICPDKGAAYLNTIYNDQWAKEKSAQCMPLDQTCSL